MLLFSYLLLAYPISNDSKPLQHSSEHRCTMCLKRREMNLLMAILQELFHIFLPSLGHQTHQLCLLSRPDTMGDMVPLETGELQGNPLRFSAGDMVRRLPY